MKIIYVLEDNRYTGPYAYGDLEDPVIYGDAPTCPACGRYIGMLEWLPPYRIKLSRGTKTLKPGDVIFGNFVGFMVSERFREVWEQEVLQGIVDWRPVDVVKGKYKGLALFFPRLKPATARADFRRMKVLWGSKGPPKCQVCITAGQDAIKGIYLDESTIPIDDLFHAMGLTEIFASERFKEIVDKFGLINADLIPAPEYGWNAERIKD